MLIGLLFAGVIVLVGFPLLLYVWLWHTKVSELKLTFAYFISVALLCVALALNPNDPTSILSLTAFLVSFILTLPWSVVAGWVLSEVRNSALSDREFAVVMLFGAGLNAVLLYFIAAKMRRLIK